jgi:hypothetical protein
VSSDIEAGPAGDAVLTPRIPAPPTAPNRRSAALAGLVRSPWAAWSAQCLAILALALAPWPGWGEACASAYCDVANAVASAVPNDSARVLFRPGDDPSQGEERVPWRVYVYMQEPSTGAVDRVIENERLDYASVATFLALAAASSLRRWRTKWLWAAGLPAILAIVAIEDANRIFLALDGLHWIALGPVAEIALSAVYAFFNGMPIVPFAVPGLLWWGLLQVGRPAQPR